MFFSELFQLAQQGDPKSLARLISLVESRYVGYQKFFQTLSWKRQSRVIGITGPPGAGKSTLTDALLMKLVQQKRKVAVLCVDPTSPFSSGALLGDRIRMQQWHNEPSVYIRSLASRGALGGLGPMTIEITDVLRACGFDDIIIETVGVGQSEVDIASLADITNVVLVPESGDEIQTMKSGLLEIADIFVINKCDRPGADRIKYSLLSSMQVLPEEKRMPVVETTGTEGKGVEHWLEEIDRRSILELSDKKTWLLAEKAWQLIAREKMKDINKEHLLDFMKQHLNQMGLYRIVNHFIHLP